MPTLKMSVNADANSLTIFFKKTLHLCRNVAKKAWDFFCEVMYYIGVAVVSTDRTLPFSQANTHTHAICTNSSFSSQGSSQATDPKITLYIYVCMYIGCSYDLT